MSFDPEKLALEADGEMIPVFDITSGKIQKVDISIVAVEKSKVGQQHLQAQFKIVDENGCFLYEWVSLTENSCSLMGARLRPFAPKYFARANGKPSLKKVISTCRAYATHKVVVQAEIAVTQTRAAGNTSRVYSTWRVPNSSSSAEKAAESVIGSSSSLPWDETPAV